MNFLRKIFTKEQTIELIVLDAFQTLPFDCLLEIVSYLPLPECMFLRSSCHQLKAVVDYHFRTRVQTLSVLLSALYSPKKCNRFVELSKDFDCKTMIFGSTSGYCHRELIEYKEIFFSMEGKDYFRLENYLILFDIAKFNSFVSFITKYFPKITKLALVIDHDDHLERIPKVLNIYRSQLKVLLLEKTFRSWFVFMLKHNSGLSLKTNGSQIVNPLPTELYHSVNSLDALEELYFFANPTNVDCFLDYQPDEVKQRFQNSVFHKLRVLHISEVFDSAFVVGFDQKWYLGPKDECDENLEELACYSINSDGFDNLDIIVPFPRLEKCILLGPEDGEDLNSFYRLLMCDLKEVRFNGSLVLTSKFMERLSYPPSLERIHCLRVDWEKSSLSGVKPNITLKEIEIDKVEHPTYASIRHYMDPQGFAMKQVLDHLTIFMNLEKVIIREPFMVLTGDELPGRRYCIGNFHLLTAEERMKVSQVIND